jgi:hypothetical protein
VDHRHEFEPHIHGRRVHADGQPAGRSFAITSTANSSSKPAITSDGRSWFVVWESYELEIATTPVTADGTVVDPNGIQVTTAAHLQAEPAIAFDGRDVVIAWSNHRYDLDGDIYAARLTTSGELLDPKGIPVSTGAQREVEPAIASAGGTSFIVWEDNRARLTKDDIYGARLRPAPCSTRTARSSARARPTSTHPASPPTARRTSSRGSTTTSGRSSSPSRSTRPAIRPTRPSGSATHSSST